MLKEFEVGPIRPPSESESLLLRITRNCSWNKCKFCLLYKGHAFRTRPFSEIKEDIDTVAAYRDDINVWLAEGKPLTEKRLSEKLAGFSADVAQQYVYVLNWLFSNNKSVFLQDANTMALSYDKLIEIIDYLKKTIPEAGRITSYSRVDALEKFTVAQLIELRKSGLDRIHSGFETGSDKVLELIQKGYTKKQEIEGGRKVKEAGIELSVYVMPGVGGKELSEDNALETADVISQVNPDFVRIRTFVLQPKSALMEDVVQGRMTECTDKEKLQELKKMIENLHGTCGFLYSDHIINLLEDVNGSLAGDRDSMLAKIQEFENLPERKQKEYQLARRMGLVRGVDQMQYLSEGQVNRINQQLEQAKNYSEFEDLLTRYLRRYI